MKAAEAVIQCLRKENVRTVFGYPGAAVVPIYEALRKSDIEHILVRQEQAAGHCASGYARATGKIGVCIVTSGPGATNLITAIAAAYMDSIPMVIITGQVKSNLIGRDVFQELDITGATESFTKYNFLVKDSKFIPKTIKEAFYIAGTGRKGPVLVDIPVDVMDDDIDFEYPEEVNIRGYKPTTKGHIGQIIKIVDKIKNSRRPLICAGGGIILAHAETEFRRFVEISHIPVVNTLMGKGSINETSKYHVGLIGTHGFDYANKAVENADVLILLGARATDRTTCGLKNFAENADVIHIDIDPAEIGKNLRTNIPVVGDLKNIILQLIAELHDLDTGEWLEEINRYKEEKNASPGSRNKINPGYVLNIVSEMLDEDSIITADVGQNQIWCAHNFKIVGNRKFLTSGGLGTMGYSLPAAIGAKIGCPEKKVIAFMGDGGFQMSFFEMATISEYNIDITIILFNNSGLGMVRQIQDKNFLSEFGVNFKFNPDFLKLAGAYGIRAVCAKNDIEFNEALKCSMASRGAFLIECIVDPHEKTF
ncbi:MAG: biosynthetic-type acetolactate synthase large subunit [Clostridium sp.]|jgi:acetolactate synthase-1/2/3 large subunit|uniref:biosynthetic-type acetolactate synthase large subunit n=1 Tax=Clostridium sp. TaxID=1506 RepID=UPI0025BF843E|nr:biosynthetic-type acetolactate synthase large subunit [Clostridium sp.]MCH3963792.1 biosynthetic-type acetolactate synthase large subunit [Clostridium sp.]MCI1714933.1 biosynthetic-type acetolactate synthase large subunit [Clostridium sp.]MCI1798878.1 biosynthetic-type acetolactate synthase large subunit [Clostridium sp.]MCI1813116.1 biosynthetic-type acetolactate synthase large subunit [Clostridium sp.]MCI1870006.1 biosynthetic-type acetolactate synthase large subunit [Clostridium sp.]